MLTPAKPRPIKEKIDKSHKKEIFRAAINDCLSNAIINNLNKELKSWKLDREYQYNIHAVSRTQKKLIFYVDNLMNNKTERWTIKIQKEKS